MQRATQSTSVRDIPHTGLVHNTPNHINKQEAQLSLRDHASAAHYTGG